MNIKSLPKIIEEVGFDFDWSNENVWALNIPVEKIDIKELEWHFDIPFRDMDEERYNLKPNDVITFTEKHQNEYERTMRADLSFPIDIMENKGKRLILDGLHRLVKAKILGQTMIEVRKIPRNKIPEIVK